MHAKIQKAYESHLFHSDRLRTTYTSKCLQLNKITVIVFSFIFFCFYIFGKVVRKHWKWFSLRNSIYLSNYKPDSSLEPYQILLICISWSGDNYYCFTLTKYFASSYIRIFWSLGLWIYEAILPVNESHWFKMKASHWTACELWIMSCEKLPFHSFHLLRLSDDNIIINNRFTIGCDQMLFGAKQLFLVNVKTTYHCSAINHAFWMVCKQFLNGLEFLILHISSILHFSFVIAENGAY